MSRRYKDFIPPNPHLREWMLPYLPRNTLARDIIITLIGTGAGAAVCYVLAAKVSEIGVPLAFAVMAVTLWQFPGEVRARYAGASIRYHLAKQKDV